MMGSCHKLSILRTISGLSPPLYELAAGELLRAREDDE
jgi:hypothetical protein